MTTIDIIDIEAANRTALGRLIAARPVLTGVATARDAVPGMRDGLLLHAGPPIGWERMSGPLRGAVVGALLFEGWAKDEAEATVMAEHGEVDFEPCHHHQAVGPMAGVVSPSMAIYVVEDRGGAAAETAASAGTGVSAAGAPAGRAFSTLNEGYGKVLRYGAYAPEVLDRLRWMNGELAPLLAAALAAGDGIDLRALVAEALHMGDEGHKRNKAGSLLFTKLLAPRIAAVAPAAPLPPRRSAFSATTRCRCSTR